MKVGRREFLKLLGATVGTTAIPKKVEEQPSEGAKEELHHVVHVWGGDGSREYYVDGEGPLSLEEYAKAMGIGPDWIFATNDRCDCPECQAALAETEGWVKKLPPPRDPWPEEELSPPESGSGGLFVVADEEAIIGEECSCPVCKAARQAAQHEYDCDMYLAISEGAYIHKWIDPLTGVPRYTELSWGDHGLHTVYLADGQYLGQSLSKGVDPFDHVRSIWAAGLVAAMTVLRR